MVILSLGQPLFDGRVHRMSAAWAWLGYQVSCLTPPWSASGGVVAGGIRRLGGLVHHLFSLTGPAPTWIHACDAETLPVAWLLSRRFRAGLLYDAHECFAQPGASLNHRLQARLEELFIHSASRVITVNSLIAAKLQGKYHCQVATVPNYLTTTEVRGTLSKERGQQRVLRGFTDKDVILVYSGALFPGRGLEDLPDLAMHLPRHWKILVKGFGPLEELFRRSAAAGCGRLLLEPAVKPLELVAQLRCADLGLLPYPPGRGNNQVSLAGKCFEYAAAGLGILSSPIPAVRSFITDTGIGRVVAEFTPAEVIPASVELLKDSERIRRRGKEFSQAHTLEHAMKQVLGELEQ